MEAEPTLNQIPTAESEAGSTGKDSPPPVPEEFRREQTEQSSSEATSNEPDTNSDSTAQSEQPITPEVMGFDATFVIQEAINEIANCKQLFQLSERTYTLAAAALNQLHQQSAGGFININ